MKKLLIVCGSTATGKTTLALTIAKKFDGELISCDSRQVYKGMDVGTGKDLPKNSKIQKPKGSKLPGCYIINGVRIWGYDLVEPNEEFSVAQYIKIVRVIIEDILTREKLPILVGGTGLYIKGVTDGIPTVSIKPNPKLRKSLEEKTKEELFEILGRVDPVRAASLNSSDSKNPRRLVRAIEVGLAGPKLENSKFEGESLFIGLTTSKETLDKRIDERVDARVQKGIEREIKTLIKSGVKWGSRAMDSLGYHEWRRYFESPKVVSRKDVIEAWKVEEHKFAKRQMTWFKKDKRINWFDISLSEWQKNVEKLVRKWYSNDDV